MLYYEFMQVTRVYYYVYVFESFLFNGNLILFTQMTFFNPVHNKKCLKCNQKLTFNVAPMNRKYV